MQRGRRDDGVAGSKVAERDGELLSERRDFRA